VAPVKRQWHIEQSGSLFPDLEHAPRSIAHDRSQMAKTARTKSAKEAAIKRKQEQA